MKSTRYIVNLPFILEKYPHIELGIERTVGGRPKIAQDISEKPYLDYQYFCSKSSFFSLIRAIKTNFLIVF
ncbi:unnamed protein product [Meloidogyne enterolobii]|uniref:Uncharacterized protein n=1 Tax=Meloidogyne enterolobii TaxID=390850 RepID=A0ACB0Y9L0_MELEN